MKYKLFTLVLVALSLMPLSKYQFNASETRATSSCMVTSLSADKDTVEAGRDIKFTLDYQSVEPACSAEELANEEYTIDFSPLVGDYGTINATYDTEIFNVDIASSGLVTITFKDWDTIHNTVESFEGSMVFTIEVSNEVDGNVIITNDVTSDIGIEVTPPSTDTSNTSKWADQSYANVGDVLDYNVRINTDGNEVTQFTGTDSPSSGLKYLTDSVSVTNLATGEIVDPSNYQVSFADNNLVITNNVPFSEAYVLHYKMLVIANNADYTNTFEAIYDNLVENGGWTIDFDTSGDGQVTMNNGQIDILKTDQDGTPLANAEFDVINRNGNVVDHVVSGEDGHAITTELAFGNYQVVETVAPAEHELDSTPHDVEIKSDPTANNIASITVVNQTTQTPDITNPEVKETGSIKIVKKSETNDQLAGAEFDVTDANGNLIDHVTTGDDGTALVSDLELGTYNVVETVAPDGYEINETSFPVTIDSNGQVVEVEVIDKKIDDAIGGGKDVETSESTSSETSEVTVVSEESEPQVNEQPVNKISTDDDEQTLAKTGTFVMLEIGVATAILCGLFYIKFKKIV